MSVTAPQATPRQIVEWYYAQGVQPIYWPQIEDDKGPRREGWQHERPTLDEYHEGNRVGLFTGYHVAPGEYLHDTDIDWAPGIAIAHALLPEEAFRCSFGRASKSISHLLTLFPEALPSITYRDISKTPGSQGEMLIELRGTTSDGTIGFQTMVPPSVWSKNGHREPLVFHRLERPSLIADVARYKQLELYVAIGMIVAKHLGKNGFGHDVRLCWAGFLLRAGIAPDDLIRMGEGMSVPCTNLEVDDVRRVVESTTKALASGSKKVKGGPALAKILGTNGKAIVARINEWLGRDQDFIRDHNGAIIKDSQENIRRALVRLGYDLSFNTFADKFMVNGAPLEDAELVEIWARIDEELKFKPEWEFYKRIIKRFAWSNPYHPVRDYLDGLVWDGTPRIDQWIATYGGAVDPDLHPNADGNQEQTYLEAISSIVLIAAVRRIRQPGCKYDEMVVFESPQGFNKSTALRALCPRDEWFSDDFPLNLKSKELIEATGGKWIIEASELSGKRKAELERLKALMSRQTDGPVRKAYGYVPSERPRHFILVGTTNHPAYLNDPTGARRFWPVTVQRFKVEAIKSDRDQLWAEAAHREAKGESIRLEERLWPSAAREQERRRELDPWEDTLRQYLLKLKSTSTDQKLRVPTSDLWHALGIDRSEHRDRMAAMRIADIMYRFGFVRGTVRIKDDTEKGYIGMQDGLTSQEEPPEPEDPGPPPAEEPPF